jgi:MFS family permease
VRPYLSLFRRNRDFRRVYLASLVSLGGDWFALIPLLTVLARETGGGLWGGLVLAADTALFALASPYAGVVADRLDRRRLMVVSDLASAALVLLLLLVDAGRPWVAVVAVGGIALAKAFAAPASSAALPNLVDPDDLPVANVLVGASWGTMLAVGAAAGGLFAGLIGERACFVVDAASFLVSAWLIARAARPFQQPREAPDHGVRAVPSLWRDLRETATYVHRDHHVLALLTCKSGVALGNGPLVLFPILAVGVFGVGAVGTGLFYAARGVGALVGPVLLMRFANDDAARLLLQAYTMAGFGVAYVAFGAAPGFALAVLLVAVAHLGGGANWTLSSYGLQVAVPDRLRGRVFSVDLTLATLGVTLSQLLAGVLSDVVPVRPLASGFGAVTLAYAGVWAWATRRVRHAVRAQPRP